MSTRKIHLSKTLEALETARVAVQEARENLETRRAEEAQMRQEAGPGAVWDAALPYGEGNFETPVTLAGYRLQGALEGLRKAEKTAAETLLALLAQDQEKTQEATARALWAAQHVHNWVAPRGEKPRKDSYGVWRIECSCDNLNEPKNVNGQDYWFYCQGTRRFEAPTEKGPWKASFGQ